MMIISIRVLTEVNYPPIVVLMTHSEGDINGDQPLGFLKKVVGVS